MYCIFCQLDQLNVYLTPIALKLHVSFMVLPDHELCDVITQVVI